MNAFVPESPAETVIEDYRRRFLTVTFSHTPSQAFTEDEERLLVLSGAVSEAIWDCDLETGTVRWNDRYQELFGQREPGSASADWWIERIHPEDRSRTVGGLESALTSGANHWIGKYRFRMSDGSFAEIRDRTFIARGSDGTPRRLTSAKADLTEQHRIEAELYDSASILHSFYESVPIALGVAELVDGDLEVVHANPAACRIMALAPDRAHGSRLGQCGMPPEIVKEWIARYAEAQSSGRPVRFEYFSRRSDRWFAATLSVVVPGESGRPRFVYTAENITQYKRTLAEQRESEERFRRLYESNIIGIVSSDGERLLDCNDIFLQMVGHTRMELEAGQLRWLDLTAPEYRHLGPQTIAGVKSIGSYGPFEKEYLRKDGSRIAVLVGCIRLQENPYQDLSFVLDLTESKKLQQRVLEAQKFESVGVLAGGIAHDFNNILVGVIGHASLAQDLLPPGHQVRDLLAQIVRNGEHAAHLTRQLLAYSGKGQFLLEPLHLSALFEEISILVRPAIARNIAVEMNLPADLPAVDADRGQMRQVFTNLVLNAAESIGEQGGRIWVETGVRNIETVSPQETWAAGEARPGPYVYLEVVDTGCGMDEATKAKIFDPFYTTKFVGRGLGLAAVAGIVRGHKGALRVTSTPGQGTRFLVLFPSSAKAIPAEAPKAVSPAHSRGTVLVVDDEAVVRQMARAALERHGYQVELAENGPRAIEVFQSDPMRFSLIVLDLSMPGMSGAQALPELRRTRPEIPVLITSGYGEAQTLGMFAGQKVSGFLQKPFSSQVLLKRIGDTMEDA